MKQFVPTCLIALLGCLMIQQEAQSQQDIYMSAGRRGLEIAMAPQDLLTLTGGKLAALVRD